MSPADRIGLYHRSHTDEELRMGRVIYAMNVSLDGYINDAQGSLDWVGMDDEIHAWFNDRAREADAFVYGRRMWETMAAYWPDAETDADAVPVVLDFARIWNMKPKIVISSTLPAVAHDARLARADAGEVISALREEFPGDLDVGGAILAGELIRRGLVDEYRLVVHPVILGAGTPFFPRLPAPISLELRETRRFASGATLAVYRPAG
jgi:dihydrofolate reductase